MKSECWYMCKDLKDNDEINEFVVDVYISFYKHDMFKQMISELGEQFNINNPSIHFHDMSTYEFIDKVVRYMIKNVNMISCTLCIDFCVELILNGEIKLSILDKSIADALNNIEKGAELRDVILSKNIIGTTSEVIFGVKEE